MGNSGCKGYLLVEGVNIYDTVHDTNQLSTVRGGSLLLKLAVEYLGGQKAPEVVNDGEGRQIPPPVPPDESITAHLDKISTGASSGLYRVKASRPDSLEELEKRVRTYLEENEYFRWLSFVVVTVPEDEANPLDFRTARERLLARLRLQQLRRTSLSPDTDSSNALEIKPCYLDGVRRAWTNRKKLPGTAEIANSAVSESCWKRYQYGRFYRHYLYLAELEALEDKSEFKKQADELVKCLQSGSLRVTREMDQIAECSKLPGRTVQDFPYPALLNKVAVIYLDGNGFGRLQSDLDENGLKEFDRTIKGYRREFLAELIQLLNWHPQDQPDVSYHRDPDKNVERLRLETLLWGGDEMLLVVPAWRGFQVLWKFYETSRKHNWEFRGKPLTHAGGLVFCNRRTPIARMRRLAEDLAGRVKEHGGRFGDSYDFMALESIDYPTETLSEFFRKRYGALAECRPDFLKPPEQPPDRAARDKFAALLTMLPKSQVYRLARTARAIREVQREKGLLRRLEGHEVFFEASRRFIQVFDEISADSLIGTLDAFLRPGAASSDSLLQELSGKPDLPPTDESLYPAIVQDAWRWLHLAESWDYLEPWIDRQEERS